MRMHMGQTMAPVAADGMMRTVRSYMERLLALGAADPGVLDLWIAEMLSEQINFQVRSSATLHVTQLTQASHSAAGMVPGGCARVMCIVDEAAVQIVLKQKLNKQQREQPQQHDGANPLSVPNRAFQRQKP